MSEITDAIEPFLASVADDLNRQELAREIEQAVLKALAESVPRQDPSQTGFRVRYWVDGFNTCHSRVFGEVGE